MTKKIIWALLILFVCVIVFIFNRGNVKVDLLFTTVDTMKSLVFFVFMGLGILVGLLLK